MKKFLAMMLAVLMLLSMATVAMAEETKVSVTISFKNKVDAGAPETTYTFTFNHGTNATGETYRVDGPLPETKTTTITMAGNPTGQDVSFNLGDFTATGMYLYTVTRTFNPFKGGNDSEANQTYKFVVNVYYENGVLKSSIARMWKDAKPENPDDKLDAFTTTYQAGTLTIKKVVDSYFDADDNNVSSGYDFSANFTYVNAGATYEGTVYDANNQKKENKVSITGQSDFTANASFKLNDGEYIKFENLPYGTTYEVTETNPDMTLGHRSAHRASQVTGEITYSDTTGKKIGNDITDNVEIKNAFDYNGDLYVQKVVAGNFGDIANDEFTFHVTGLKASNIDRNNSTIVSATDTETGVDVVLKHNGVVKFENLPYGTRYTVTEENKNGYTSEETFTEADKNNKSVTQTTKGTIDQTTEKYVFTNTNSQDIATGVSLDTLPYVLVLALAGAGLVLMIARKRRVQD